MARGGAEMTETRGELEIDGMPVTWIEWLPAAPAASDAPLVILAHGAGAPYTHPFMVAAAEGLVRRGLAVTRFHFPYMENIVRTERRRPPNPARVLLATWEAVIADVTQRHRARAIVLSGKSMGGRMASMLLADGDVPHARAAVYLGYPLHPPGKPEKLRSEHLPRVPVPQLFVSGTKDNLCRLDLLTPVLEAIGDTAQLHVVDGGDHSLATSRKEPLAGSDLWLDAVATFVASTTT